jgi:hypothetical protein
MKALLELEDAQIERLATVCLSLKTVTPSDRFHLRNLIEYYRKKPHPFTACYRDNVKRWGPELTKKRCAVLKDVIVGNTKWRKGNQKGLSEDIALSEVPLIPDSVIKILDDAAKDPNFAKKIATASK